MSKEMSVGLLVVVLVMQILLIVQLNAHGNSNTATKLQTARNIELSGAIKGKANFDGSGDIIINTSQDNIAIINGSITLQANPQSNLDNNSEKQTILEIDFPKGFNKDNCVCIAFGMKAAEERNYSYGVGFSASYRSVTGSLIRDVILDTSKIKLNVWQMATSEKTAYYRLVLMKIS